MPRAIVRYSLETGTDYLTKNQRSNATNDLRTLLREAGFEKIGTATWEGEGSSAHVLGVVESVVNIVKRQAPDMLDHLWLYVDSK